MRVIIVTDYWPDGHGSILGRGKLTHPPARWVSGESFLGIRRAELAFPHLQINSEVKRTHTHIYVYVHLSIRHSFGAAVAQSA
jgi:hypothetical protein